MSKLSVEEKFQIEDSPWNNIQTQGVNFGDYKARVKAEVDKAREVAALEQARLGDINRDDDEVEAVDN